MPPDGIELTDDDVLFHYCERQDVVIWSLEPVQADKRSNASASRR